MFSEISRVPYCNINNTNRYIRSLEKITSRMNNTIELIFINLKIKNSILFPGKLLVPYNILENEDGSFVLIKVIKLAKEALKNKRSNNRIFL